MLHPTIKFDKDRWARIERIAAAAGYSSAREFVLHIVDKELARLENAGSSEDLRKRLKGLGYIE